MVLARVPNQVAWKRTAPVFFFCILLWAVGKYHLSLPKFIHFFNGLRYPVI